MFSRFLYAVACREVSFLKKDKFLPIMESELWSAFFLFQPLISGLWNLHKGTKKTFWSYLLRLTQSFEHLEAFPGCLRSPKRVQVLFSFFFQLFWHYGLTCCYLQSKWLKNLTLRHYGRHQKHFFFFALLDLIFVAIFLWLNQGGAQCVGNRHVTQSMFMTPAFPSTYLFLCLVLCFSSPSEPMPPSYYKYFLKPPLWNS
jgi:hypothetical protein